MLGPAERWKYQCDSRDPARLKHRYPPIALRNVAGQVRFTPPCVLRATDAKLGPVKANKDPIQADRNTKRLLSVSISVHLWLISA